MGLTNKNMMRDIPQTINPTDSPVSAFAQSVDSAPESWSFTDKFMGRAGVNPNRSVQEAQAVQQMMQNIISDPSMTIDRVKKLAKLNPAAAPSLLQAFDMQSQYQSQISKQKDIYSRNFGLQQQMGPTQDGGNLPAIPRNNYAGAISELNALGPEGVEQAKLLAEQQKSVLGKTVDAPSAVQEWEYLKREFPGMKMNFPTYLEVKRQGYRIADIGGVPSMAPTVSGLPTIPLSTLGQEVSGKSSIEAGKKSAEVKAGAQAQAEVDLGSNLDEINKMRTEVDGLLQSKGFDQIYGIKRPLAFVPSTEAAASEARRNQLEAATFGISIQKMKGLGQLSDAEGKKVTAAYTRAINTRQGSDEARKAWSEVKRYLDVAERRAIEKAGKQPVSIKPGINSDVVEEWIRGPDGKLRRK